MTNNMISYVTMNYCTYFYIFMSGRASKCFVCVSHFLPWFDPFLGPIRPSLNQVIIQVEFCCCRDEIDVPYGLFH